MTDETNQPSIEEQLAATNSQLADITAQFQAVKSKNEELLNEAKAAKNKAREAAEEAERRKLEKAAKEGDYKQLLESSEKERTALSERLNELTGRISSEKTRNEAMRIAAELADGPNAEILSEFVARRIKYTEEGVKVLDASGNLTVSTLDQLKQEFSSNEKFKSLLRGNKASGGGATGSTGSAGAEKTITRERFDSLSAKQKMDAVKSGTKVIDQH